MLYQVSVAYLYREDGRPFEHSINIIYECDTHKEAVIAGIKWAINRAEENGWQQTACIKIWPYQIGRPEPSGYIKSGSYGISAFGIFEWKYDTSPFTIKQLLEHHQQQKGV